jgi:hypothetical protein
LKEELMAIYSTWFHPENKEGQLRN